MSREGPENASNAKKECIVDAWWVGENVASIWRVEGRSENNGFVQEKGGKNGQLL